MWFFDGLAGKAADWDAPRGGPFVAPDEKKQPANARGFALAEAGWWGARRPAPPHRYDRETGTGRPGGHDPRHEAGLARNG